jgi:hypothetical protein
MPCVFGPYAACDINDIYARGKTLNDVWELPFLQEIRRWQRDYGYSAPGLTTENDRLRPCPFRDHYGTFCRMVDRFKPEPEDEGAVRSSNDKRYRATMVEYGAQLERSYRGVWQEEYVARQYPDPGRRL